MSQAPALLVEFAEQRFDPPWSVRCIRGCQDRLLLRRYDRHATLACLICGFDSPPLPNSWQEISITALVGLLSDATLGVTLRELKSWAFEVKYTHPSYLATQRREHMRLRRSLQDAFSQTAAIPVGAADVAVLSVGCNNGSEIDLLPVDCRRGASLGIDVASAVLTDAARRHPGLRCAASFVEELGPETRDLQGRTIADIYGEFELCLALQVMQSRYLDKRVALERVRTAIRPGAWCFLGVPRWRYQAIGRSTSGDAGSRCVPRTRARANAEQLLELSTHVWGSGAQVVPVFATSVTDPLHFVCIRGRE